MCEAPFEASPSKTKTAKNVVRTTAPATATTAAVVSGPASSVGAYHCHVPRYRRARPCCACQQSAGDEEQSTGSSSSADGETGSDGVLGGGAPSSDQTTTTLEVPSVSTGGGRVAKNNNGGRRQGTSPGCPKCSEGMGRSPHQHQQLQQQQPQHQRQDQHNQKQKQELSSKKASYAGNENWSLERAVAAWGGGREWLRLLRKRPRHIPSSFPSSDAPQASTNSHRNRRQQADSLCLPVMSRKDSRSTLTWSRWARSSVARRLAFVLTLAAGAGVAVSLVWALRFVVTETYIRSYCFQVRAMQQAQIPRGECHIVKLTRQSRAGWDSRPLAAAVAAAGEDGVGGSSNGVDGEGGKGKLKFGILVMCDEGMWPRKYTDMSIENKNAYAELHGYDVIVATNADVDRSRPAAWSKLLVLQKYLDNYDYLIFVDIDAFIMNPAFKLEWLLDVARMQQQTGGTDGWGDPKREPHLIVTRDWNGPNSGVILMKNSDFSRWLLKEWWDQDQFVEGHFPFQYEQRAMHYLMQPDTWRKAGLPYYADHEVIRVHTAVIDQCAMNSYLVHPWQGLQGRTKDLGPAASYVPGDFILHFAGKKGRVRLELVDYYYPEAVQAVEDYRKRWRLNDQRASGSGSTLPRAQVDGDPAEHRQTEGHVRGVRERQFRGR